MSKLLCCAVFISVLLASQPLQAQNSFNKAYTKYTQSIADKDYASAVKYAEQAYQIGQAKYQGSPKSLLNLKHNLALAYSDNKQGIEAFSLMKEVTTENAELYGEYSKEAFFAQVDALSTLHSINFEQLGRRKTAIKSLIDDTADTAQILAQASEEEAAGIYYLLASQINTGNVVNIFFKRAKKAAEIAEKTLLETAGSNDTRTIEMQFKLGQFNGALKKRQAAVKYFETIVSTIKEEMDASHPYELASHANLVKLYEDMGESDKATEHCIAIGQLTPWQDDIDQIPLHRVHPKYPVNYAKNRKSGKVIFSFDIDDYGFVKNPEVLDAEGGNLFVKEAKRALLKWRYAPKVENGKPVYSEGHKVQLDFKISV